MTQPEFIFMIRNAMIHNVVQGDHTIDVELRPNVLIKHYYTRNDKITIEFPEYKKKYVVSHREQMNDILSIYQKAENVETRIAKYCEENLVSE